MKPKIAKALLPLVNNPQTWEPLEEYLLEHIQWTNRALAVEISELELRRLQGKAALLEMFSNLPDIVRSTMKNYELEKKQNA